MSQEIVWLLLSSQHVFCFSQIQSIVVQNLVLILVCRLATGTLDFSNHLYSLVPDISATNLSCYLSVEHKRISVDTSQTALVCVRSILLGWAGRILIFLSTYSSMVSPATHPSHYPTWTMFFEKVVQGCPQKRFVRRYRFSVLPRLDIFKPVMQSNPSKSISIVVFIYLCLVLLWSCAGTENLRSLGNSCTSMLQILACWYTEIPAFSVGAQQQGTR